MKVRRNDPCPCGSGEKYKNCCINASYYETLYNSQIELLQEPTIENCQKVISLGNTILAATQKYVFSTGASTNNARAYLYLLYATGNGELVDAVKNACDVALQLKPENQQALLALYEFSLYIKDYITAGRTLLSIHVSMIKRAKNQILILYQRAIKEANIDIHYQQVKDGLDELTMELFRIYGNLPELCCIATLYYMGIGNDTIRAYEVGKKCIEVRPNSETLCNLGLICITPPLDRPKEAILYLKRGLRICNKKDVEDGLKSNLLAALIKDGNWPEAITLGEELTKETPNNTNYHNYAELLKHLSRHDEAVEWCKKALFLIEDDCTLLSLADIYRRNQEFEKAIETYLLCLSSQRANTNALTFIDENGRNIDSIATNTAIDGFKLEAFTGLIQSNVKLKNYEKAWAFLTIGKEIVGDNDKWAVWNDVIPMLSDYSKAYNEVKTEIAMVNNQANSQRNCFRQWASTLLQLQGNSQHIDLDQLSSWSEFEDKMDAVLDQMRGSIVNHSTLYSEMKTQIISNYAHLDTESIEFLITANIMYDIHRDSFIDFAPIIVEYAKIVEKRLRILLAGYLPHNANMLGQIINVIERQSIVPFKDFLDDLKAVNGLRKESAHTGRLTRADADAMRNILLINGLLNRL